MVPVHLRSLQALELAVRTGSLAAAAAQLSITPAAVGQRIKAIEDYLGMDLIVRGRSGIRPTRYLEPAMAHLGAAFRELETTASILDFQRVHEIHVAAGQDFAELWLRPRLAAFKASHPNTLFCINGVGDVPVRLGNSDCEIWFGPSRRPDSEDALMRDYLLPVSSPANARRFFRLPEGEQLEGMPLLHLDCYAADPAAIGWPEWTARHGYRKTAPSRGIRYQHVIHAIQAIYSDAGIMICGAALLLDQLDGQRLALPFPVEFGAWTSHAYRIGFRKEALRRAQVAQFRDWLLEESRMTEAKLRAFVSGEGPKPA